MHRRYDFPMTLSVTRQVRQAQATELWTRPNRGDVRYSSHARSRAARRNLEPADVEYVLTFGRPLQRTGCTIYFLAGRDIPRAHQHQSTITRLEGTAVLIAGEGEIITVYRNREAYRTLCRKAKYRLTGRQLAPTPQFEASVEHEDELTDADAIVEVIADHPTPEHGAA